MSNIDASTYDNTLLDATSYGSSKLYSRDASAPLGSTIDDAIDLGDLVRNQTQLDAASSLSRANGTQYYKFDLSGGGNLKLLLSATPSIATTRVQVLNSAGTVVADSSTTASQTLQDAYEEVTSSDGLALDVGEYYAKVTYDATSLRSETVPYNLALYSGDGFNTSYKTIAKPQTSDSQVLLADGTQTFSTIDAQSYSTEAIHSANETLESAVSIGWIAENKSALSVSSSLTDVCEEEYYSFILQEGDNLKFTITNHTDTEEIRVQIYDVYGTNLIADSHGTDEQKAAYAALNTEEGIEISAGQYNIKISYAEAGATAGQVYDFSIYSGDTYEAMYETTATTISRSDALYLGQLVPDFSVKSALASYLTGVSQGSDTNIMDFIS